MKKKFGQNFLTDTNLLKKIIDSANIKDKDVIEIGPGQGALTKFLVLDASSVTAYEVDSDLKLYLNKLESEFPNLKVNYQDILKVNLDLEKEYHVVANIPYNITSPIIFKILDEAMIKSATLMVQKEVCDRITASPNNKEYNALSVIIQYYMNVEKIMNVNKKMFRPIPKVDSAVFKMTRKERELDLEEETIFLRLVKGSFHQKRKTLLNNISFSQEIEKEKVSLWLNKLNIDGNLRAENIKKDDFIKMAKNFKIIA
ncbi:dimethyladenosine transferase [Haploplasma axanthum]|uniref:Ribosomal RNA small subunit methyltransferase A n=2 Tax=Haploplasma axanthum TaxID=29552 RepID=A0A449BBE0_HAPAX|nr:dimethyladenosine transferase [Haploplasma axanthum]